MRVRAIRLGLLAAASTIGLIATAQHLSTTAAHLPGSPTAVGALLAVWILITSTAVLAAAVLLEQSRARH
jgi:hypothetical protein